MNGTGIDPMAVLAVSSDPEARAWAINELRAAGFAEPEQIERDLRSLAASR